MYPIDSGGAEALPSTDVSVTSRLEYMGGDMFKSVPAADAYILKHIIHDWDDEKCILLLKNCRSSMNKNGRLICVDSVLPAIGNPEGASAKFLDLLMLTFLPGKERTEGQWTELYRASGFEIRSITAINDAFGTSIVEGRPRA